MADRGATEAEIEEAVRSGEMMDASHGRMAFRKNFPFHGQWKGKRYNTKQVRPIVAQDLDRLIVVTVYVYYFGEDT